MPQNTPTLNSNIYFVSEQQLIFWPVMNCQLQTVDSGRKVTQPLWPMWPVASWTVQHTFDQWDEGHLCTMYLNIICYTYWHTGIK